MKTTSARWLSGLLLATLLPACGGGNPGSSPSPGGSGNGGQAPTIAITSPDSGATFTAPATIDLSAEASDADGTVSKVEFFHDGTLLGTATAAPFTVTWSDVPPGDYTLRAVATDNEGAQSTSDEVHIAVSAGGGTFDPTAWTKFPGNPVLSPSPDAGAWDSVSVRQPFVLKVGASWVLWYAGGEPGLGPNLQIGRAVSSDGQAWTKSPSTPVLPLGAAGSFDAVEVFSPSVLFDGTTYRMWYSGTTDITPGTTQIGLATSSDGVTWTKSAANPVLTPGPAGSWDAFEVLYPSVVRDATGFRMWYTGRNRTGNSSVYQIGYATSTDGLTWTRYPSPVVPPTPGSFDASGLQGAKVIEDGGTFRLWYHNFRLGVTDQIGYATSPDGINWTKLAAPVLAATPGSWDDGGVYAPMVLRDGSTLRMWYTGIPSGAATGEGQRIGLATTP